jgi:DNA-binding transcriptional regulator YdaS (Cro superfamily)
VTGQRKPVIYVGQSVIAAWFGVTAPAVSNWLVRHKDTAPEPDVVIAGADGGEVLGWLPTRRSDWRDWNIARIANDPGRSRYVTDKDRENWR